MHECRMWACTCVCVFVCVCVSACGCVVCLGRKHKVSGGATDVSVCKVLLVARPLPNAFAPWSPILLLYRLREGWCNQSGRGGQSLRLTHLTPAIIHTQPTTPHHHAPQAHTPAPPHPFRCAEACTQCDHGRKADQPCIREVHRPCVGVRAGCMSVGCGHARVCPCLFVCVWVRVGVWCVWGGSRK